MWVLLKVEWQVLINSNIVNFPEMHWKLSCYGQYRGLGKENEADVVEFLLTIIQTHRDQLSFHVIQNGSSPSKAGLLLNTMERLLCVYVCAFLLPATDDLSMLNGK